MNIRTETWPEGAFDPETVELFQAQLRDDELEIAHRLHDHDRWPEVNVSFKAKGRKGSLGLQPQMMNYRDHMSYLLCRLAVAREETGSPEEGIDGP